MTTKAKMNPNTLARITGFLYLLMIPLGILGIIYVPVTLIVSGDVGATVNNIMENELLFRSAIVAALSIQIVQIFLVLALYKLLKPANKNIAAFMVISILVAVPIAMFNELNHFAVLILLSGADYLTAFSPEQIQAFVAMFLDFHEHGILIAQIFWGIWLFPMGYLVFKSGYLPRIIGILLMIGCFGYMLDSFILFFNPDFDLTISGFTFVGEVLLPLWLVIKGVNVEEWEKRALESA